jgi:hypothetical protein
MRAKLAKESVKESVKEKRQGFVERAFEMDRPTLFGLFAVTCALGSIHGFLQGAWPFGQVEAVRANCRAAAPERQAATHCIGRPRRRVLVSPRRGKDAPRRPPSFVSVPCGLTAD